MVKYCKQCATQVEIDQAFCPSCGATTTTDEQPTSPHQSKSSKRVARKPTIWLQALIVILGFIILITTGLAIINFLSNPIYGISFAVLLVLEVWIVFNLPKYHNGARYLLVVLSSIVALVNAYLVVTDEISTLVPLLVALFFIYVLVLDYDTSELFSGKYRPSSFDMF